MNNNFKSQQIKILQDPIKEYFTLFPNGGEHQIARLKNLWEQYLQLKKRHEHIQSLSGQVSRNIGKAKRNGESIEPLKSKMQEYSTQTKNIASDLRETGEKILTIFELNVTKSQDQTPPEKMFEERSYPLNVGISDEIEISQLDNNEHKEWNNYVESNPAASIYHRAEWKVLIQKTFGHESYYYCAKNKTGIIIGVLPLIRLKSRLFGDFMVSMPYFNYGGAIADHPSIEQKLMDAANQNASSLGISHIEYRDDVPRSDLHEHTKKVNMILPLPSSEHQLWDSFSSKLRSQIRRPQRENPNLVTGGKELLEDFYTVFAHNMRDLGTPVYGKMFFRNILHYFPDNASIIVVSLAGRPVAAAFLIGHGDTLEIPWASTIRTANKISMNMCLYWEALQFAVNNKFRFFDFGRSSKESGTFRFKQQWGAKPKQLYWNYWLPKNSKMPSLNPNNPKYSLMIAAWKRLPVTVSKLIGPMIVKNLP